jgi:hypothetical protein
LLSIHNEQVHGAAVAAGFAVAGAGLGASQMVHFSVAVAGLLSMHNEQVQGAEIAVVPFALGFSGMVKVYSSITDLSA